MPVEFIPNRRYSPVVLWGQGFLERFHGSRPESLTERIQYFLIYAENLFQEHRRACPPQKLTWAEFHWLHCLVTLCTRRPGSIYVSSRTAAQTKKWILPDKIVSDKWWSHQLKSRNHWRCRSLSTCSRISSAGSRHNGQTIIHDESGVCICYFCLSRIAHFNVTLVTLLVTTS